MGKESLILISFVLFTLSLSAQGWEDVKYNRAYITGEGYGNSIEEADRNALNDLISKIAVNVSSSSSNEDHSTIKNGELDEVSRFRSSVKTYSQVTLTNTESIIIQNEPKAHVGRWIKRSEIEKIFSSRMAKVKDLVETGKIAESRLQIDDALRCYYQALLLSRLCNSVSVEFGNKEGTAQSMLPVKIRSVLLSLRAEVIEGEQSGNRYNARLKFTYDGRPVSSVSFSYNDGQGIVGPVKAKEGIGEVELLSLPQSGKIHITYETRFRSELDPLDGDFAMLYNGAMQLPLFSEAGADIAIKVKGGILRAGKQERAIPTAAITQITPEATNSKTPITLRQVQNANALLSCVQKVEDAIRSNNPVLARNCFTQEGYELFSRMMTTCGQVSLVGRSNYEFVEADGYLVGRYTRIKLKYRGGKTFIENLVYRFDKQSGKIRSVAFALTKVGENDIMNAAAQWPEVSRWAVLSFMEDYQTAFALKRDDYISSIFSEEAVIITGAILKKAAPNDQMFDSNKIINLGSKNSQVKYSKLSKEQYIERLRKIFREREYVNLTFENNVTKIVKTPRIFPRGALFGIEINQRYASSGYSDDGYLTLLFDTRQELPVIYYRMWQPDKTEMVGLQEFIDDIPK